MQALAAAPAAPALIAKTAAAAPQQGRGRGANAPATLDVIGPDAAAEPVARFFTPLEFSALRRLSALFEPPTKTSPGAVACGAPEFLDFLIGTSPADRQQLYRTGLGQLNSQAKKQFSKTFADADDAQAHTILAPALVAVPWPKEPPKEPLKAFVFAAREDIAAATRNSPEYAAAAAAEGRRVGGLGLVWKPIDPVYRG